MPLNPTEKANILNALQRAIHRTEEAHLAEQVIELRNAHALITEIKVETPCRQCLDFAEPGYCKQWKQAIPADWLSVGCNNWLDEIPF
ncbi:MAG: hypothetical protein EOM21_20185 [Gammaproteobacteria bacterium]|nr:hypothetical protein [Gammaproteobacteria bacterium]